MATIGSAALDKSVFELFDGMRSYDAKRAVATLAEDADWESPWSGGKLTGKAAIEAHLKAWLGDVVQRPSFAIGNIAGDGNVTRLNISVSGRAGKGAAQYVLHVLCLRHVVHHVAFVPAPPGKGH